MSDKNLRELDGKGLLEKAQKSVEENNLEGALEVFTEIIRRTDAKVPATIFSRATCYIQLKRYKEAIEDCKLILALPDAPIEEGLVAGSSSLHSASYSRLNNAYKSLNMLEEASDALKSRSQLEQDLQKKNKKVENAKSVPKRNSETASDIIENASTTSSDIPSAIQSKVNVLKEKANNLYQDSKYEEAIKIYDLALEHYSDNSTIHSNLSQTYIKMENFDKALFHANETIRIKPDWAKGYYRQGMALMKLNKFQEANKSLEEALQLAPEDQLITSLLAQSLASSNSNSLFKNQQLQTALTVILAVLCAAYIAGFFDSNVVSKKR